MQPDAHRSTNRCLTAPCFCTPARSAGMPQRSPGNVAPDAGRTPERTLRRCRRTAGRSASHARFYGSSTEQQDGKPQRTRCLARYSGPSFSDLLPEGRHSHNGRMLEHTRNRLEYMIEIDSDSWLTSLRLIEMSSLFEHPARLMACLLVGLMKTWCCRWDRFRTRTGSLRRPGPGLYRPHASG